MLDKCDRRKAVTVWESDSTKKFFYSYNEAENKLECQHIIDEWYDLMISCYLCWYFKQWNKFV